MDVRLRKLLDNMLVLAVMTTAACAGVAIGFAIFRVIEPYV